MLKPFPLCLKSVGKCMLKSRSGAILHRSMKTYCWLGHIYLWKSPPDESVNYRGKNRKIIRYVRKCIVTVRLWNMENFERTTTCSWGQCSLRSLHTEIPKQTGTHINSPPVCFTATLSDFTYWIKLTRKITNF